LKTRKIKKKYFDQKGTVKETTFEEKEKVWLQDKFKKHGVRQQL